MSGFVALVHADGRPVEEDLIVRLTQAMAYRGPDGTATKSPDGAALGHAAFHTLEDPAEAPQPLHHDGRLWIVADARIDNRGDLVDRLAAAGHAGLERQPDALLLAHAYDVWGESMVEKLLGDFAFLIWDAPKRTLFGARDHLGVKPFYYASLGCDLLAGNTLEGLRAHPGISDELDERAIADYLLFGLNRHAERTSFADIRRLPPAHSLSWQPSAAGRPAIDRYWTLHVSEELRFKHDTEYVERFDELFSAAVADRVRGSRAAVLMSGGLDSTSVAALARRVMADRYDDYELAACTFVFEELADDPEPEHAARVAATLGIPIHRLPLDRDTPEDLWGETAAWSAEPTDLPASARVVDLMNRTVPGIRVGLTGQGGDPTLHVTPEDAVHRARSDGWLRSSATMARYALARGRLPRTGLRTALRRRGRGRRFENPPLFPPWIPSGLADRLGLRRRHHDFIDRRLDPEALRPEAEYQLAGPEWSFLLEWYDAGMTGFAAELRHPLLDLRVVEFLLAVPPIPWLVEKEILRLAMRKRLPAPTLSRRKTPVDGYAIHQALISNGKEALGLARGVSGLAEFVDLERFSRIARKPERLRPWEYELITRPLGLASWLRRLGTGASPGTENPGGSGRHDATQETVPHA